MKIIVIVGKENTKKTRLMLELPNKKLIKEIKTLISTWRYSEAISNIIRKGRLIKELAEEEINHAGSDLILTETAAYWNLL